MKKGFTLIELLGIIVILGLIVAFTAPSIMKTMKTSDDKEYQSFLDTLALATETYYEDNTEICDFNENSNCYISIASIISEGYIGENLINPRTKKTISYTDTMLLVKTPDGTISYDLVCSDMQE